MLYESALKSIKPAGNDSLRTAIRAHLDDLTKPPGSLGRIEEFAMAYCLCRGNAQARIERMALFTFAGDHGITQEGVAPYPSAVTRQMVINMVNGGAAVSVMCRHAGIGYKVVDMGVDGNFDDNPVLLKRKVARGTANFRQGPAMTAQQCAAALDTGCALALESIADLYGIGEMGIGNSSSASALYSMLLDINPEETVGAGTGATGDLLERKKKVITESVTMHRTQWDKTPVDALRRVGGYEIAGMTGFVFGAASKGIPVVVDGFIASAAALVAMEMSANVRDYLFFSHASAEKFHTGFLAARNIRPILTLDMRLGEGTGAALAMSLIGQAMHCYHEMATFSSAGVANKNA